MRVARLRPVVNVSLYPTETWLYRDPAMPVHRPERQQPINAACAIRELDRHQDRESRLGVAALRARGAG